MILTPAWSGQQIFRRQKIDLGYVTSLNFPFLFYVIWQLTAVPKIASTFSGRLIYAPSRLRNVFPVLPLFKGRSSISSSFYASLLQAIDGVMSLALCPQVVSQAPQHFSSSNMPATRNGWLCLPAGVRAALDSDVSKTVSTSTRVLESQY